MNKQERIKRGLTGKKTLVNPKTGEKSIVDFDDPESGCTMTRNEMMLLMEMQLRRHEKNFSGFTEEEQKLYSQINMEDDDNI